MTRASVPVVARVVGRLGVDVERVVFGHIHRLGRWTGAIPSNGAGRRPAAHCVQRVVAVRVAAGAPRKPPHPYWPGGAVLIEPGADRRAIGLLYDLAEDLLH